MALTLTSSVAMLSSGWLSALAERCFHSGEQLQRRGLALFSLAHPLGAAILQAERGTLFRGQPFCGPN